MSAEKVKKIVSGLWLRDSKFGKYYSVNMTRAELQEAIDRCNSEHLSIKVNAVVEKKTDKSPDILLSIEAALSPEDYKAQNG